MRSETLPAPLRAIPWSLLLAVLGATALGLATLYSAAGGSLKPWAFNQGLRFGVLLVAMFLVSLVRPETWRTLAYPIYAAKV